MRHDPASAAIVIMMRSLKTYGMAQAVEDLIEQGSPAFEAAMPILSQLLKAEVAEREVRSIAYHLKVARFPAYKDLAGFDFAASEINEPLVRQLHRCEFIDGAHNVVLIGGPGTGKTHVATALGVQAVEHHRKKVRFFSTTELVSRIRAILRRRKVGHFLIERQKLGLERCNVGITAADKILFGRQFGFESSNLCLEAFLNLSYLRIARLENRFLLLERLLEKLCRTLLG